MTARAGRAVFIRFGAPALVLLAATAAILLVRAGLRPAAHAVPEAAAPPAKASVAFHRSAPVRARGRFYVIRAGDTLGAIAARLKTSVDHLLELNPGVRPTSLRIGQKLRTG